MIAPAFLLTLLLSTFAVKAHAAWPYDYIVKPLVTENMLNQPESRMKKFCPAWKKLTRAERVQMYQDLVYGIAYAESGASTTAMYLEPQTHFVKPDMITGKPVISEGLTQLSYQDGRGYGSCVFDFKSDRDAFLRDLNNKPAGKSSWKSQSPTRSILRPDVHLQCTVGIIDSLLKSKKRLTTEFSDTLGAYWSTMRRSRDGYKRMWSKMRERKSPCL